MNELVTFVLTLSGAAARVTPRGTHGGGIQSGEVDLDVIALSTPNSCPSPAQRQRQANAAVLSACPAKCQLARRQRSEATLCITLVLRTRGVADS